jgi:hypothetical protein
MLSILDLQKRLFGVVLLRVCSFCHEVAGRSGATIVF